MDRRSFIRNSAAATLAAAPRAPAANDRIQLGFVGVGGRGGWLARAFNAIGQKQGLCRVVAVCDIWERRRREAAELYKCQGYTDYREVVNRADVDAVVVATPDHWHATVALAALNQGKDVYVEKPMCHTLDEARRMMETGLRTQRILQVGANGGSSNLFLKAKELLAKGAIGQLIMCQSSAHRNSTKGEWNWKIWPDCGPHAEGDQHIDWQRFLGPAPEHAWEPDRYFNFRKWWDYSGGIATDLFVHLMTTIHFVMGAKVPELVVATGANYRHQKTHEVPDTLNASVVYGKENFCVSLSGTFNSASAGESGFAIMGHEGSLTFRDDRLIFKPEHQVEGNGWIVSSWPSPLEKAYWADPAVQKREKPETWPAQMQDQGESWSEVGPDSTVIHVARFFESIRTHKPSVEDGRAGHHAAAVAHMVNESIKRKAPVAWDFEKDVLKKA